MHLLLIYHLSYPRDEHIDMVLCSVSHMSFDMAVCWVLLSTEGPYWQKQISNLLFDCCVCIQTVSICWDADGRVFIIIDRCLPMGCSISCSLFKTFSYFFGWFSMCSVLCLSYMYIGPAASKCCRVLVATVQHVVDRFGVLLAPDKEGHFTVLSFLGILTDTSAMECWLLD